jgi:tetratricopeptide (TPR) repeat protein
MAIAAFEQEGLRGSAAQARLNLALTYRDQGALDRALDQAQKAVAAAAEAGELLVVAQARRARAEIWLARGELQRAELDIAGATQLHRTLGDAVGEAEALRVSAALRVARGNAADAERMLRDVIARTEASGVSQIVAGATADLAVLLRRAGKHAEARTAARAAQAMFTTLGAEGELRKLAAHDWEDELAAELHRALEPLHEAEGLVSRGRYAELLAYLKQRSEAQLEKSPTLALLYGIGHARLARLDDGQRWAMVALAGARRHSDRPLQMRALNVCGAIALERGAIPDATNYFARAQELAVQDGDQATLGRCANNLGIVECLQGDYGRAVGSYTRALAAYQQARHEPGVAEAQHNLGIAYRELGKLDRALEAADTALLHANRLGDRRLKAQALAGRAEISLARGEPALARREVERALATHRELHDTVLEVEDLRILALAMAALNQQAEAEALLRDVIARATPHARPLLIASAQRDLARLLAGRGLGAEAVALARTARASFDRLGAVREVRLLEALLKATPLG